MSKKHKLVKCTNVLTGSEVIPVERHEFVSFWDKHQGGGHVIDECITNALIHGTELLNHNGNIWVFGRVNTPSSCWNIPKDNQMKGDEEIVIIRCYDGLMMNDDNIEAEYAIY